MIRLRLPCSPVPQVLYQMTSSRPPTVLPAHYLQSRSEDTKTSPLWTTSPNDYIKPDCLVLMAPMHHLPHLSPNRQNRTSRTVHQLLEARHIPCKISGMSQKETFYSFSPHLSKEHTFIFSSFCFRILYHDTKAKQGPYDPSVPYVPPSTETGVYEANLTFIGEFDTVSSGYLLSLKPPTSNSHFSLLFRSKASVATSIGLSHHHHWNVIPTTISLKQE